MASGRHRGLRARVREGRNRDAERPSDARQETLLRVAEGQMSAVLSMKREREKLAFSDRLAAIERMLKRGSVGEPERLLAKLLTAEEVADLLGLKLGTIRNMTSRRELPCVHLGKRAVRYRLADILALIEARS